MIRPFPVTQFEAFDFNAFDPQAHCVQTRTTQQLTKLVDQLVPFISVASDMWIGTYRNDNIQAPHPSTNTEESFVFKVETFAGQELGQIIAADLKDVLPEIDLVSFACEP